MCPGSWSLTPDSCRRTSPNERYPDSGRPFTPRPQRIRTETAAEQALRAEHATDPDRRASRREISSPSGDRTAPQAGGTEIALRRNEVPPPRPVPRRTCAGGCWRAWRGRYLLLRRGCRGHVEDHRWRSELAPALG